VHAAKVLRERALHRKLHWTEAALARPVTRVYPHVHRERRRVLEAFAALCTDMWTIAGVRVPVTYHRCLVAEKTPAHLATKRSLAGVHARMHAQCRATLKRLGAHLAGVRTSVTMTTHVRAQRCPERKRSPTDVTNVVHCPCVSYDVLTQSAVVVERLRALFTLVRAYVGVYVHVIVERSLVFQRLIAQFTNERFDGNLRSSAWSTERFGE